MQPSDIIEELHITANIRNNMVEYSPVTYSAESIRGQLASIVQDALRLGLPNLAPNEMRQARLDVYSAVCGDVVTTGNQVSIAFALAMINRWQMQGNDARSQWKANALAILEVAQLWEHHNQIHQPTLEPFSESLRPS